MLIKGWRDIVEALTPDGLQRRHPLAQNSQGSIPVCEACGWSTSDEKFQLRQCVDCGVRCHPTSCYYEENRLASSSSPFATKNISQNWKCQRCLVTQPEDISCIFCPHKSGLLIRILLEEGHPWELKKDIQQVHWAHYSCVADIPDIAFRFEKNPLKIKFLQKCTQQERNNYAQALYINIEDKKQWKKRIEVSQRERCYLCNQQGGILLWCENFKKKSLQCFNGLLGNTHIECQRFFHVRCGLVSGIIFSKRVMRALNRCPMRNENIIPATYCQNEDLQNLIGSEKDDQTYFCVLCHWCMKQSLSEASQKLQMVQAISSQSPHTSFKEETLAVNDFWQSLDLNWLEQLQKKEPVVQKLQGMESTQNSTVEIIALTGKQDQGRRGRKKKTIKIENEQNEFELLQKKVKSEQTLIKEDFSNNEVDFKKQSLFSLQKINTLNGPVLFSQNKVTKQEYLNKPSKKRDQKERDFFDKFLNKDEGQISAEADAIKILNSTPKKQSQTESLEAVVSREQSPIIQKKLKIQRKLSISSSESLRDSEDSAYNHENMPDEANHVVQPINQIFQTPAKNSFQFSSSSKTNILSATRPFHFSIDLDNQSQVAETIQYLAKFLIKKNSEK